LPDAYLEYRCFEQKEADMSGSTVLTLESKRAEGWEHETSVSEELPAWDLESSPRLYETDLDNPESFHRRLVDWLMSQK
jgi:hypothetical protein